MTSHGLPLAPFLHCRSSVCSYRTFLWFSTQWSTTNVRFSYKMTRVIVPLWPQFWGYVYRFCANGLRTAATKTIVGNECSWWNTLMHELLYLLRWRRPILIRRISSPPGPHTHTHTPGIEFDGPKTRRDALIFWRESRFLLCGFDKWPLRNCPADGRVKNMLLYSCT